MFFGHLTIFLDTLSGTRGQNIHNLWGVTRSFTLIYCRSTYVRELLIYLGHLTMNILDIILDSHLSFVSIFFDGPNGELCVLSIVNFSIFVRAIFRYMFGILTVHFFDILSDALHSATA